MSTSYIPQTDAGYLDWLNNFSTLITATPGTYGLLASDATAINAQKVSYQAAYSLATDPGTRTSATVAAKDAAKAQALFITRPYAVQISKNAGVSNDAKASVGVTIAKTVPTPVPPPTTSPAVSIKSAIPGAITLAYKDPSTPAGKAKPFGVTQMQVWASQGTVAGTDPLQASFLCSVTKSPFVLDSTLLQSGKTITLWARWQTRSGAGGISYTGPWSAPLVFVAM